MLGHYLALRKSTNFSSDCPLAMVGLIDEKASPYAIALNAIEDAKYMCTRTHGDAPEVRFLSHRDWAARDIFYILCSSKNTLLPCISSNSSYHNATSIRVEFSIEI